MPRTLPTFRGYTIDARLGEFRSMLWGPLPEFIDFNSHKGVQILHKMALEKPNLWDKVIKEFACWNL